MTSARSPAEISVRALSRNGAFAVTTGAARFAELYC
jgi:hypothetical protein